MLDSQFAHKKQVWSYKHEVTNYFGAYSVWAKQMTWRKVTLVICELSVDSKLNTHRLTNAGLTYEPSGLGKGLAKKRPLSCKVSLKLTKTPSCIFRQFNTYDQID